MASTNPGYPAEAQADLCSLPYTPLPSRARLPAANWLAPRAWSVVNASASSSARAESANAAVAIGDHPQMWHSHAGQHWG